MSFKQQSGFTIVELLIAIVVIAILAAISIVAYTGIQNRAHDSTVQNDLRNAAQALQIYRLDAGHYPSGWAQLSAATAEGATPRLVLRPSRESYAVSNNYIYCNGGAQDYTLVAQSRAGTTYYINASDPTPRVFPHDFPMGQATVCPSGSGNWGYTAGDWQSWVSS